MGIWGDMEDVHKFIDENSVGIITEIDVGGIYTKQPYEMDIVDVEYTAKIYNILDAIEWDTGMRKIVPKIKKVVFNPPVTVVIFEDDSKEIVRTDRYDNYSPDIGVAMALMKKMFGSRSSFKKFIDKFVDKKDCPLCKSESVYNYMAQCFECKNSKCLHVFIKRG